MIYFLIHTSSVQGTTIVRRLGDRIGSSRNPLRRPQSHPIQCWRSCFRRAAHICPTSTSICWCSRNRPRSSQSLEKKNKKRFRRVKIFTRTTTTQTFFTARLSYKIQRDPFAEFLYQNKQNYFVYDIYEFFSVYNNRKKNSSKFFFCFKSRICLRRRCRHPAIIIKKFITQKFFRQNILIQNIIQNLLMLFFR